MFDGIGAVLKKLMNWLPNRRESLNNRIDAVKEEMANVINKKPFDSVRYNKLVDKLQSLEKLESRAE